MTTGKVEVPIEKWEEIRDENVNLKRENETLRDSQSIVKIVLTDRRMLGNLKYDRWKEKNVFIDNSKSIESVEYVNLEAVKEILKEEAAEDVIDDLKNKDKKIKSFEEKIKLNNEKHVDEINNIKKIHKKNSKEIKDGHAKEIESLKISKVTEINKINKQLKELKSKVDKYEKDHKEQLKDKKIEKLESDNTNLNEDLNKAKIRIDELEKTNSVLFKRLPFWRRK